MNITFEDADVVFTVTLEDSPSKVSCDTMQPPGYEGDVDLEMYALGNNSNACSATSEYAADTCNLNVGSPTVVIIKVALFSGDPLAPVMLRCFAGPVMDLQLGDSIPLDMPIGDFYTFNFKSEAAPSQVVVPFLPRMSRPRGRPYCYHSGVVLPTLISVSNLALQAR